MPRAVRPSPRVARRPTSDRIVPCTGVVVLALDGVYPFELGIPPGSSAAPGRRRPLYEVITCTVDGGPVRTDADFTVAVEHGARGPEHGADTVVIPPFTRRSTRPPRSRLPEPLADGARSHPAGHPARVDLHRRVRAGRGRAARRPPGHHPLEHADLFQRLFPQVELDPDVLFVDDGDVLTSAGVAAGVDLCLHLVRRDHGSEVANRVARRCVVPPWRDGGQAQFIERPVPAAVRRPPRPRPAPGRWSGWTSRSRWPRWPATRRMSVRTFTRRFRDETGLSPASG